MTVADSCGKDVTTKIRNTVGKWSSWSLTCGTSDFNETDYIVGDPVGQYKYRIGYHNNCACEAGTQASCTANSCVISTLENLSSYGFPNSSGQYIYCVSSSSQPYCGDPSCRGHIGKLAIVVVPNAKDWDTYISAGSEPIGVQRATWVCP